MNDVPSAEFPNYNHNKYGDNPGQLWTADDQCRVLLRDRSAYAYFRGDSDLQVGLGLIPLQPFKFQRGR